MPGDSFAVAGDRLSLVVLFNHEGIAIIETMALNSETEMLIAFNVFDI